MPPLREQPQNSCFWNQHSPSQGTGISNDLDKQQHRGFGTHKVTIIFSMVIGFPSGPFVSSPYWQEMPDNQEALHELL
jgi:hypothetical protein